MKATARQEATKLAVAVVKDLLKIASLDTGRPGSMARQAGGDLIANAEMLVENATVAAALAEVFNLTRLAGASVDQIETVRKHIVAVRVKYNAAFSVKNCSIRFALVQCAHVLADTAIKSRPEIDRYIDRMNAAFEQAELVAGNSLDQASYRAIIALHAAVTFDLTTRARPLPQMLTYDFARHQPALWIAQRLYCDAERTDELVDENKPVHPAFVQNPIRALSQ